jgi:hypothetical protein
MKTPSLISPHSLGEIKKYLRQQRDSQYRRKKRHDKGFGKSLGRRELYSGSSDDDADSENICGNGRKDGKPGKDDAEAASEYFKNFSKSGKDV